MWVHLSGLQSTTFWAPQFNLGFQGLVSNFALVGDLNTWIH